MNKEINKEMSSENSNDKKSFKKLSALRKSTPFYIDWKEAFMGFSDDVRLQIYDAITDYAFYGTVPPSLGSEAAVAFSFIKPIIDRNAEKYDIVCAKNRSNINKRWNPEDTAENTNGKIRIRKIPSDTKNTDNDNDNDNEVIEKSNALFATYQSWLTENAPYCVNSEKFKQLTTNELWKLATKYSIDRIKDAILNLEKKKSVRKKYAELYKVLSDSLEKTNIAF